MAIDLTDPTGTDIDPRLIRLRVELFAAAQTLKGDNLKYFHELVHDVAQICDVVPLVNDALKQATERAQSPDSPQAVLDHEACLRRELLAAARTLAKKSDPASVAFLDAYLRMRHVV